MNKRWIWLSKKFPKFFRWYVKRVHGLYWYGGTTVGTGYKQARIPCINPAIQYPPPSQEELTEFLTQNKTAFASKINMKQGYIEYPDGEHFENRAYKRDDTIGPY